MSEIDKLRNRLKNVNKNVTEYKMTIQEAQNLINEFTYLEQKLAEKPTPTIIVKQEKPKSLDGGTFTDHLN